MKPCEASLPRAVDVPRTEPSAGAINGGAAQVLALWLGKALAAVRADRGDGGKRHGGLLKDHSVHIGQPRRGLAAERHSARITLFAEGVQVRISRRGVARPRVGIRSRLCHVGGGSKQCCPAGRLNSGANDTRASRRPRQGAHRRQRQPLPHSRPRQALAQGTQRIHKVHLLVRSWAVGQLASPLIHQRCSRRRVQASPRKPMPAIASVQGSGTTVMRRGSAVGMAKATSLPTV